MKKIAGKILDTIIFLGVFLSLYVFWFEFLPSLPSEFQRGFVTMLLILFTPLFLLFAIAVFVFDILGKEGGIK